MVWSNDAPINEAQLQQMREEFWDTAPSYEGRKEIWEALRGACEACEKGDYDLAQAILEGVGVSLPNGECCTRALLFSSVWSNMHSLAAMDRHMSIIGWE